MNNTLIETTKQKMTKAMDVVTQDLASIRSGRATPSLIEQIEIPAYGGTAVMKLMELATISAPDAKTLVIQPYDQTVLPDIERGIQTAKTGLTPIVDGEIIRISIPALTEERRKEFIKLAHTKIEAGKIMVRQIRQDAMHESKKDDTMNEDQQKMLEKQIQDITDQMTKSLDDLAQRKEKELMQM